MLILTRRRGEAVDLIDSNSDTVLATVTVLEYLPDGVVRLGFDAAQSIRIVRDNALRRDNGKRQNTDEEGRSYYYSDRNET